MKKTVLFAAVAAALGGGSISAHAAWYDKWTPVEGVTDSTITDKVVLENQYTLSGDFMTIADGAEISLIGKKHLGGNVIHMAGGTVKVGTTDSSGGLHANEIKITGGKLDVTFGNNGGVWGGHANVGGYYSFEVAGGEVNVGQGGRLWIGMEEDGSIKNDMLFTGGVVNMSGVEGNAAVISTMTELDGRVDQTLAFRGSDVNVDGVAEFYSRDVRLEA